MTAHTLANELRQTLDTYLDTLAAGGKSALPHVKVKRSQYQAWLKTEGVAHYRGVQLVPVAERKRYKRTSTANWVQALDAQG